MSSSVRITLSLSSILGVMIYGRDFIKDHLATNATQSILWDKIGIRRRIKYCNHNLMANECVMATKIDCPLIQKNIKSKTIASLNTIVIFRICRFFALLSCGCANIIFAPPCQDIVSGQGSSD